MLLTDGSFTVLFDATNLVLSFLSLKFEHSIGRSGIYSGRMENIDGLDILQKRAIRVIDQKLNHGLMLIQ